MIQRRTLLLAGTAALAGCASLTPAAIASDVQLVATGVQALAPLLGPLGVPAATIAQVVALAADVSAHVTSIGSVVSSLTPPSNVAAIVTDVNAIATMVNPFTMNAAVGGQVYTILVAAQALLPAIEAAAGLPVPTGAAPGMSPDDARSLLKSL